MADANMIMPASHSKQQAVKLECVEIEGGTQEGALQLSICLRCAAARGMLFQVCRCSAYANAEYDLCF